MTTEKHRWPLNQILPVAHQLVGLLGPFCDRIAIAGSVRRTAPLVGDIEILAVPTAWPVGQSNLFALSPLDEHITNLRAHGILALRPNKKGVFTNGPLNKLLSHTPTGIPVDLFVTGAENWGMSLMVRTGPKDWNIRVMSELRRCGMQGHAYGGITGTNGELIDCPDEETVFRILQWPYLPPSLRS
jgi:DNA polymerase/3'-5' exonuclease PolX